MNKPSIRLIKHYLGTIWYLRPIQLFYKVRYKLFPPRLRIIITPLIPITCNIIEPIKKPICYNKGSFVFLNLESNFLGWNDLGKGKLWAYYLNYMDWLQQENIEPDECVNWIDKFIAEFKDNKVGFDTYPTALRCVNWVKLFVLHPECQSVSRNDFLYSQFDLIKRKLEYESLGNHLLEDYFALYIGSVYFDDKKGLAKVERMLYAQLKEQILNDGAHYEQSPMYQCVLLDRLLDCINFRKTDYLVGVATAMLGHLSSIVWPDNTIPILNDSAVGVAPSAEDLFDYARRLGITWKNIALNDCGYRRLKNTTFNAIVDVGNIKASYQPGHTHADTFNYELQIDGFPFIVDTGVSTYNKDERRLYERSTKAHNTVSINDMNSSDVWSGFRVGQRARVRILKETENYVIATHDGYKKETRRTFLIKDNCFCVTDDITGIGISRIHLAPKVNVVTYNNKRLITDCEVVIDVDNAIKMEVHPQAASVEFNKLDMINVVEITFKDKLSYCIGVYNMPVKSECFSPRLSKQ